MGAIQMDQRMLWWLTTLGYQVGGKPKRVVEEMFLQEARQWGLSPEQLKALLKECYPGPDVRQAA